MTIGFKIPNRSGCSIKCMRYLMIILRSPLSLLLYIFIKFYIYFCVLPLSFCLYLCWFFLLCSSVSMSITYVGWQIYCQFTVLYGSGISKVDGPWVGYLWVLLFEDRPVWNGHLAVTTKGFLGDSDRNKSNPERRFLVCDSHMTTCAANQAPNLRV